MIENQQMITIAFIGEQEVGKTSIIQKYFNQQNLSKYTSTIAVETSYSTYQTADGACIPIKYWDTAGDSKYKNMVCYHLKGADIIVLVYNKYEAFSFKKLQQWKQRIDSSHLKPQVIIILANDKKVDDQKQIVQSQQGKKYAKEINAQFFEIQLQKEKKFDFIQQAFETVLEKKAQRLILQKKNMNTGQQIIIQNNYKEAPCKCEIF